MTVNFATIENEGSHFETEIEVDQLCIGSLTYDPLHPESWRECIHTF